jgi:hypothetical protein
MKKIKTYLIVVCGVVILYSFISGYFDLKMHELNLINSFTLFGYVFAGIFIPLLIATVFTGISKGWKNFDWNRMILSFIVIYFLFAVIHYMRMHI